MQLEWQSMTYIENTYEMIKENERSTIGHTTLIFQNTSSRNPIKVFKCFPSKKEKNK